MTIDEGVLDDLRALEKDGSPGFLKELLETFFSIAPRHLGEMRKAFDSNDAKAFARNAHSLKSCSANLGATHLSELCKTLELLGKESALNRVEGLSAQLDRLDSVYVETKALLEKALTR